MKESVYIKKFIRQVRVSACLFFGFIGLLWIGGPLLFYIDSYQETMGYGLQALGAERFQERISDALKFTWILLGTLSILFLPLILVMAQFFSRYFLVLKKLSAADIRKLKAYADLSSNWLWFLPPFIFYVDSLYVFKITGYNRHRLTDIIYHHLERNHSTGNVRFYHFRVSLKTTKGSYFYTMSINNHQANMLQRDLAEIKLTNYDKK